MLQSVIVLVSLASAVLGGGNPVDYELSHLQSSRSYDYGSYGTKEGAKSRIISSGTVEAAGSELKASGSALYGYGGGHGVGYGGGHGVGYGGGHGVGYGGGHGVGFAGGHGVGYGGGQGVGYGGGHGVGYAGVLGGGYGGGHGGGYGGHGGGLAYESPINDYQAGYGASYYRKPIAHAHNAISPGIVLGQSLGVVHGSTVGYKGLNSKGWIPIAGPAVTKAAVYHEPVSPIVPIVNDVLRHTAAKLGHSEGYALAGPAVAAYGYGGGAEVHGYASAVPADAYGHGHGHGYAAEAPGAGYAQVGLGGYASAGYPVAAGAPLVHKKPAEISITPSISYGYSYKLVPESVQLHPARLSGLGLPLKGGYGGYAAAPGYGRGYAHPHSHY